MKKTLLTIAALAMLVGCQKGIKDVQLKTDKQKASYAIGQQIGQGMKGQKLDIDVEALAMSINDALIGKESRMTDQEIQDAIQNLRNQMVEKQKQEAVQNKEKGDKFLNENKVKPGVQTTASGLQYKVITEGTGVMPKPEDIVKVHYKGTLIDGTEFDSSYKRNAPASFPVNGVIKGWTEALTLMKAGSKWEIYVPAELAYGEMGRPSIPPNSVLIFEVELLEVEAAKAAPAPEAPKKEAKKKK